MLKLKSGGKFCPTRAEQLRFTGKIPAKIGIYLRSIGTTCAFSIFTFIISISPSLAGDPFRTDNPRNISDRTEAAFKTLFEEGNYTLAKTYLTQATVGEGEDPMAYAMGASIAYTEKDWQSMKDFALQTIKIAEAIKSEDPLRGNLYLAVGHFLQGAYLYQQQGAMAAIAKLPDILGYLEQAELADKNDPELNLIKGYLNLFLAVKLPYSDAQQAIEQLREFARPHYLVNRGIAVAYRDLKKYDLALEFVEKAIQTTPLNPELYYLKGQILRQKGQQENNLEILTEALKNFDIALEKIEQLPLEQVQKPLQREKRKTKEKIDEITVSSRKKAPPALPQL